MLFISKIYGLSFGKAFSIMIAAATIWGFFYRIAPPKMWEKTSLVIALISLVGIMKFTVLGRVPTGQQTYSFAAQFDNEYYREMFMNALLYFPLGLSLTVLIGPWSILAAFMLSLGIETWQYFAGTGLAQGTDVIMNTLGAAIGALPFLIVKRIQKWQEHRKR